MASSSPATNLTTERIRSAAKHLEQDSRRVQSDLNANTVLFKMVAEEMERENDSEAVSKLRQALLEVLECAHHLEYHCSALQNVSQSFEAGSELTDFSKHLDESTRQLLAADPFDPTTNRFFDQFDRAIWNIHHAGEAAPGHEQEEFVMPSEWEACDRHSGSCAQAAVLAYIARTGRRRCKCAIPGCPKDLRKDRLVCDATLKMEIEELRRRDRVTQVADYTEVDLEDDLEDEV